jgi:YD repeat-containing protein
MPSSQEIPMRAFLRSPCSGSRRLAVALLAALLLCVPASAQQEQVETYRYDDAGRITRVTYDGATTISYEYDENGNVTSENVTPKPPSSGGGGGGSSGLCFVATAAYGTPLDPHVQTLRDFRDAHLRTNAPGRAFVAFYERTSPPIAAFIARHDSARALVRWGLAPLVLSIAYPWWALLVSSSLLAGWIAWRRIRRARRLALALRSAS